MKNPGCYWSTAFRTLAVYGLLVGANAEEGTVGLEWSKQDTALANEYLSLLVEKPEYGRLVDLLWQLYARHQQTELLLANIALQVAAAPHPSVILVQAHLHRKSGDLQAATQLYEKSISLDPKQIRALRGAADVAMELRQNEVALEWLKRLAEVYAKGSRERAEVWIEAGDAAFGADQMEQANTLWTQAVEERQNDVAIIREVAQRRLRLGRIADAGKLFQEVENRVEGKERLLVLEELSRIEAYGGRWKEADEALKRGMQLLHHRDERFEEWLRRRVRLHERFDQLDRLRGELTETLEQAQKVNREAALRALVGFAKLTVDLKGQMHWLEALTEEVPEVDSYRMDRVRLLLDQGDLTEAVEWIDVELLKQKEAPSFELILLRCEADLRLNQADQAEARLMGLLDDLEGTEDREKEILAFAQERHLDGVIRKVLSARLERDPNRSEAVFELAQHHRDRQQMAELRSVVRRYVDGGSTSGEKSRREGEVASFLAAGSTVSEALRWAEVNANAVGAGREEWLRLADLLAETGREAEAKGWLEKAWHASTDDSQRIDVDERLMTLIGGQVTMRREDKLRLPMNSVHLDFLKAEPEKEPQPVGLVAKVKDVLAEARAEGAGEAVQFRAAWWCFRGDDLGAAYEMLRPLVMGENGSRPSVERLQLMLDIAQADGNDGLAERTLRKLMEEDAGQRTRYVLRWVELILDGEQKRHDLAGGGRAFGEPFGIGFGDRAEQLLRKELALQPGNELLLSSLSRILQLQGREMDAVSIWREAIGQVSETAAQPLQERLAELLLDLQRLPEYVEVGLQLIERETDVERRRDLLKRFLDRMGWSENASRAVDNPILMERLNWVERELRRWMILRPFDGFFPEALAQIHLRRGQPQAAFEAMKQAYYTSPETPFSQVQLRDTALQAGDRQAAIYFQKQVVATAEKDQAGESRRLVELLEGGFEIEEADQFRERLERRHSQDFKALQALRTYYRETAQEVAEQRVLEQMGRLQPWDRKLRLELALMNLRMGERRKATHRFEMLLEEVEIEAQEELSWLDKPLPISDLRVVTTNGAASDLAQWLAAAATLERDELENLRHHLRKPRAEFAKVPEEPFAIRLRAIEELARLKSEQGGSALLEWTARWEAENGVDSAERLWAHFYAGAGRQFGKEVIQEAGGVETLEGDFILLWLMVRAGQTEAATEWIIDGIAEHRERRVRLITAAVTAQLESAEARMTGGPMVALAESGLFSNTTLLEWTRQLQERRELDAALALGGWLHSRTRVLGPDYALMLGRIAEMAGDLSQARQYHLDAMQSAIKPGRFQGLYDPFLYGAAGVASGLESGSTQQERWVDAWRDLQKAPKSDLTSVRRAAVVGFAGSATGGADHLQKWLRNEFFVNRPLSQPVGRLQAQGSLKGDEPAQAQSFWEEMKELGGMLEQQGLATMKAENEQQLLESWGAVHNGSRSGYDLSDLRLGVLISELKELTHEARLRRIDDWLAGLSGSGEVSVDCLSELGVKLEAARMNREAVAVYRNLPARAPTNSEYAQWLLKACEAAKEVEPGKSFALQLIEAVPPQKPPQPGEETLREIHARFLAADWDVENLRKLANEGAQTPSLPGRLPPETAYRRELARLLEKFGRPDDALKMWLQLRDCYDQHDDDGLVPDVALLLQIARLQHGLDKHAEALQTLGDIWTESRNERTPVDENAALVLEVKVRARLEDWSELPDLMNRAADCGADAVIDLSKALAALGRSLDAGRLLIHAERASRDDSERAALRIGIWQRQLKDGNTQKAIEALLAVMRSQSRSNDELSASVEAFSVLIQSDVTTAQRWRDFLRDQLDEGADVCLAAVLWCALADFWEEGDSARVKRVWARTQNRAGERECMQIAAKVLLKLDRGSLAWETATTPWSWPADGQFRWSPVMVLAAEKSGQPERVVEAFKDLLRAPLPEEAQIHEWLRGFVSVGRADLGEELLKGWLERERDLGVPSGSLAELWINWLLDRQDFAAAEAFLLRNDYRLTEVQADVVERLLIGTGRANEAAVWLDRYRLPQAIDREVRWRMGLLSFPASDLPR